MATWKDVKALALALPETTEHVSMGMMQWKVKDKLFVWQRPLRKSDLAALGEDAPEGPIVALRVAHEGKKQALIERDPEVFFTIPHFDGYPAILVLLDKIGRAELKKLIVDAWTVRAPATLRTRSAPKAPKKKKS